MSRAKVGSKPKHLHVFDKKRRLQIREIQRQLGSMLDINKACIPSELSVAIEVALMLSKKYLPDDDIVCDSCGGRLIPGDPVTCKDCDYVEEGWSDND
jgi:hypothetical protein